MLKRPDIMEQLTAEREHFLESLHGLMKEFKTFLNENHTAPDDLEISPICWETKGLKQFQNEVRKPLPGMKAFPISFESTFIVRIFLLIFSC